MASKHISFIEQNCEKFLVAVAGLGLAGVVVWQLAFAEVTVDAGGSTQPLGDVASQLERRTKALKAKFEGDSAVELPAAASVSALETLSSKIAAAISPAPTLAPNQPALAKSIALQGIRADEWYYEPNLAPVAVEGVIATTDALADDALDVDLLAKWPDLASRFPEGTPRDITWTTPWARVDLTAMRAELRKQDRSSNPARAQIPSPWFNDTLYVVDVVFERQQRGPNGEWGPVTQVEPVPGADSWRADIAPGKADAATRETAFKNLGESEAQMEILQPPFLATKNGKFVPPGTDATAVTPDPTELAGASEEEKAKRAAKRRIDGQRRTVDRLRAQLEKLGGPLEPPAPGSGQGPGSGFGEPNGSGDDGGKKGGEGGGGGLGGGGGFQGRNNQGGSDKGKDDELTKSARIRLTRQLRSAERDLAKAEAEFAKAYPAAAAGGAASGTVTDATEKSEFGALESVVAWTHDWRVEPGSTYRYRCVVQCFNPFFGRKTLLIAGQQSLADEFALSTATSEWGPAITVPDPTKFFVLRASGTDSSSTARRATIELYRYVDGKVDRQVASCAPGDQVAKSDSDASAPNLFKTAWYLVDIFDDIARDAERGARKATIVVLERLDASGQPVREYRSVERDSSSSERIALEAEFLDRSKGSDATSKDAANGSSGGTGSGRPSGPGLGT